ncbi:MAG TPA: ABC transporter ATP-binding protein [Hyphomicrobiales bacterium]|nr:ABC transporter ATP-binding protein [Hyphomicrobiales bacterium]
MSYFAVENLSLRFGGLHALRGLSFGVDKGEVFAVIGPNGAGKTSLFNVVTRVFAPNEGRVLFKDRDITAIPRHRVVAEGIARTFQNIELFEDESVLENLMLGRHRFPQGNLFSQVCRLPSVRRADEASRENVERIIELLDLAPYRHRPVAGLPYGVRKVVELARALATGPELLLLDEPASGLNPAETRGLAFWIDSIRRDLGITVVMIEHDMSLVSEIADRVLCMNMGAMLAVGTAGEVQAHPDVVTAYLGA